MGAYSHPFIEERDDPSMVKDRQNPCFVGCVGEFTRRRPFSSGWYPAGRQAWRAVSLRIGVIASPRRPPGESCVPRGICPRVYLQRFDPASPVVLAVVTGGGPRVVGLFVGFQDHGVDASPAQCGEALSRGFQQGGGDALSSVAGVYGQSVGGASPSVEAGYDGSDEQVVACCEEQGFGVSCDESGHSVVVVADACSFRGVAPEPQHGVDVREGGVADVKIAHGVSQAGCSPVRRTVFRAGEASGC